MNPTINFQKLIKKQASEEAIKKQLHFANYSKKIIQQLNSEQLISLQKVYRKGAQLLKQFSILLKKMPIKLVQISSLTILDSRKNQRKNLAGFTTGDFLRISTTSRMQHPANRRPRFEV